MTLSEFSCLDHEGRLEAANKAVCIAGRKQGTLIVLLYQLNGFYIEVYYHKTQHRIVRLFGFDDMALLDPYLGEMQVSIAH